MIFYYASISSLVDVRVYLSIKYTLTLTLFFWITVNNVKNLISNFRRVLNIVCILLGISPASDCGLPTFRNPLSVPSSRAVCRVLILHIHPLKMELIEGSETSANHNRTPGKYPKEYIQRTILLGEMSAMKFCWYRWAFFLLLPIHEV